MSGAGISSGYNIRIVPITGSRHTVVAGAAGFVDTDISGDVPAGAKVAIVVGIPTDAYPVAVRNVGSAASPVPGTSSSWAGIPFLVLLTSTRHIECYRTTDCDRHYDVIGYML